MKSKNIFNRRGFLKKTALLSVGTGSLMSLPFVGEANILPTQTNLNIFGPREGYTPQISYLVSMMDWMRMVITSQVKNLSIEELDYLHDDDANTIGAMLMHLAATERFYQINTFDGKRWGDWSDKDKQDWDVASGLGVKARKEIKGNDISYYLEKIETVRTFTLQELAKRDDDWLLAVDNDFPWGPTNNLCKWFHVCEHESNHNGQIKFLKSRVG